MNTCIICGKQFKVKNSYFKAQTCGKKCHSKLKSDLNYMRVHGRIPNENEKWCCICKSFLPLDKFAARDKRYCRECSTVYDRERQRSMKTKLVNALGGCCVRCGYDKCPAAIDFHHVDPSLKDVPWSKIRKKSYEDALEQLKKEKVFCLCANCHREEHYENITSWKTHGKKAHENISS